VSKREIKKDSVKERVRGEGVRERIESEGQYNVKK
jgi:hypothetical protein